eukprot:10074958-Alexandrium_andersonii.AAC.1
MRGVKHSIRRPSQKRADLIFSQTQGGLPGAPCSRAASESSTTGASKNPCTYASQIRDSSARFWIASEAREMGRVRTCPGRACPVAVAACRSTRR